MKLTNTTIASWRTGWYIGILSAVLGLINRRFGWDLTLDDLLPLAPVAAVVSGIAYRVSRVLADRFPTIGFVLFGSRNTPVYQGTSTPEGQP